MSRLGPDCAYSWLMVLCCGFIHFALFGIFRSSGVIYVALLDNYEVDREEASWPFALCSSVFLLVGPVAGLLLEVMSQRQAYILGSLISTVGVAGCYFADTMQWINIFYGVVHGIGFGLLVTYIPVTLNQYFVKYRATALGIAFCGGTISSMIFPLLMEWLLESYTLKESFLLLSGAVLNTLVASSLITSPPWLKESKSSKDSLNSTFEAADSGVGDVAISGDEHQEALRDSSVVKDSIPKDDPENTLYQISEITMDPHLEKPEDTIHSSDSVFFERSSCDSPEVTDTREPLMPTGENGKDSRNGSNGESHKGSNDTPEAKEVLLPTGWSGKVCEKFTDTLRSSGDSVFFDGHSTDKYTMKERDVCEPLMSSGTQTCIISKQEKVVPIPKQRAYHSIRNILIDPMFWLLISNMYFYFLGLHSLFIVILDFALDKGIDESKSIYILTAFSATDLVGRACFGWVTDKNYISCKTMLTLNLTVIGVMFLFYAMATTLWQLIAVSIVCGLAVGSSITLFFILLAENVKVKNLTMVVGLANFINGILNLLRPFIIGTFRDKIGSYDWMFYFLGFTYFLFSILWILESQRSRKATKHAANKV